MRCLADYKSYPLIDKWPREHVLNTKLENIMGVGCIEDGTTSK